MLGHESYLLSLQRSQTLTPRYALFTVVSSQSVSTAAYPRLGGQQPGYYWEWDVIDELLGKARVFPDPNPHITHLGYVTKTCGKSVYPRPGTHQEVALAKVLENPDRYTFAAYKITDFTRVFSNPGENRAWSFKTESRLRLGDAEDDDKVDLAFHEADLFVDKARVPMLLQDVYKEIEEKASDRGKEVLLVGWGMAREFESMSSAAPDAVRFFRGWLDLQSVVSEHLGSRSLAEALCEFGYSFSERGATVHQNLNAGNDAIRCLGLSLQRNGTCDRKDQGMLLESSCNFQRQHANATEPTSTRAGLLQRKRVAAAPSSRPGKKAGKSIRVGTSSSSEVIHPFKRGTKRHDPRSPGAKRGKGQKKDKTLRGFVAWPIWNRFGKKDSEEISVRWAPEVRDA
ncbi:hypothetical protein MKZ38_006055 [Zalerion maritima]|uniref:Uncharacterized protein n=1 Tax=Zalerion maritima TaxID=339359 RepID=A0AAD5RJD3_9PEZI|nr:hypothetical protein MKZ38_006055 [Zalerion maritima]